MIYNSKTNCKIIIYQYICLLKLLYGKKNLLDFNQNRIISLTPSLYSFQSFSATFPWPLPCILTAKRTASCSLIIIIMHAMQRSTDPTDPNLEIQIYITDPLSMTQCTLWKGWWEKLFQNEAESDIQVIWMF